MKTHKEDFSKEDFAKAGFVQIEQSKIGSPTLKINNIYIHSKYDPIREGEQIAKALDTKNKRCLLVFGIGLGYHILPFIKDPLLKIIVIERYKETVNLCKQTGLIKSFDKLSIFSGDLKGLQDFLLNKISEYEANLIAFLVHTSSSKLDIEYYTKAQKILSFVQKLKLQSYITTLAFSKRWHENVLKNIKHLPSCSALLKQKTNLPVFLIASGPSLDEHLPNLHKIRTKGIIIAVLSVYHRLKMLGISVDFVISTDAGIANRLHLLKEDINAKDKPFLITSLSVVPIVFRLWQDKFVLINHSLPIEDALLNGFPQMPMQGSVSLLAFSVANYISCGDIYLIGFDFSFRGEYYHYRGNRIEEYFVYSRDRFKPIDWSIYDVVSRFKLSIVKACPGNARTNLAMRSYLSVLEKTIEAVGTTRVFNLTSSTGAYINGTISCFFGDILKLSDKEVVASSFIGRVGSKDFSATKGSINEMLNEFIRLKKFIIDIDSRVSLDDLLCFFTKSAFANVLYFLNSRLLQRLSKLVSFSKDDKEELIYFLGRSISLLKRLYAK